MTKINKELEKISIEFTQEEWEMVYDALSNTVYPEKYDNKMQDKILDKISATLIGDSPGQTHPMPSDKERGE